MKIVRLLSLLLLASQLSARAVASFSISENWQEVLFVPLGTGSTNGAAAMTFSGLKLTNAGPITSSTRFSITFGNVSINLPLAGDESDTNNPVFSSYKSGETHVTWEFARRQGTNSFAIDKTLKVSWAKSILSGSFAGPKGSFGFRSFISPMPSNLLSSAVCLVSFGNYNAKLRYDFRLTNSVTETNGFVLTSGAFTGTSRFQSPTVTITSPAPNLFTTNPTHQVTGVDTAVNGSEPTMWRWAAPIDDPTSDPASFTWNAVDNPGSQNSKQALWSTSVDMSAGTNWFWAMTTDSIGNPSAIVMRRFFYSVRSPLTLTTMGAGTIVGSRGMTNGAMLEIGRGYTVTAKPKDTNTVFRDWSDGNSGPMSTVNPWNFLMESNMTITANFIPNPFPAIVGTYTGIFYDTNGPTINNSGYVTINVKSDGTYSGRVLFGTQRLPFAGTLKFDLVDTGLVYAMVLFGNNRWLDVRIVFPGDGSGNLLPTPTLSVIASNKVIAPVRLTRAGNVVPAGLFNISDGEHTAGPTVSFGNSYGSIIVTSKGQANFVMHMADGSAPAASFSTPVGEDGSVSFFIPLYNGKGLVMGTLNLADIRAFNRECFWVKQPNSRDRYFPGGFNFVMDLAGEAYTPSYGTNFLSNFGIIRFDIDSTSGAYSFDAFYVPGSKSFVLVPGQTGVTSNLRFNPSSGLISGSIGVGGKKFNDVNVLVGWGWGDMPLSEIAFGYSLGTHETDSITISQEQVLSLQHYDNGFVMPDVNQGVEDGRAATAYFSYQDVFQADGEPPDGLLMQKAIQIAPHQQFVIFDYFGSMTFEDQNFFTPIPAAPYTGPYQPPNSGFPAVSLNPVARSTQFIAN